VTPQGLAVGAAVAASQMIGEFSLASTGQIMSFSESSVRTTEFMSIWRSTHKSSTQQRAPLSVTIIQQWNYIDNA